MIKKISLSFILTALCAVVLIAATHGDQMGSPFTLTPPSAGTTGKLIFDEGNGASNPFVSGTASNRVGVNTTAPDAALSASTSGGGADVTNFSTRAGAAGGVQRWKMLPSSGTTSTFEMDADYTNTRFLIQSDISSGIVIERNGDVGINTNSSSFPLEVNGQEQIDSGGLTIAAGGANITGGLSVGTGGETITAGGLTITSGGATITGGSQFNNGLAVLGSALTASSGAIISSGGLSVTGATTLNSTGGNVPHQCTIQTAAASALLSEVTCSGGSQIVTGGGCQTTSASVPIADNYPVASNRWHCDCDSACGTITAYAICCDK